MTDTNRLRHAARRIREHAGRATEGPWYADGDTGVYAYGPPNEPGCPHVFTNGGASIADIEHIAGFGPNVATAIADLLDAVADDADLSHEFGVRGAYSQSSWVGVFKAATAVALAHFGVEELPAGVVEVSA